MATVVLIRHGRTTANTEGVLAGRASGVSLDETGRAQAARTGERLSSVALATIVTSPLQRCRQTARSIARHQDEPPKTQTESGITECNYGDWQGRTLAELSKEDLWSVVQTQPSAVVFPGGESMAAMQARSVAAIRSHDAAVDAEHGSDAVWAAVSHGDVIKSVLADALGMHLDLFQRITVHPGSLSIVRYSPGRPAVIATNTEDGDLSWLRGEDSAGDAPIGGGAGPGAPISPHS